MPPNNEGYQNNTAKTLRYQNRTEAFHGASLQTQGKPLRPVLCNIVRPVDGWSFRWKK